MTKQLTAGTRAAASGRHHRSCLIQRPSHLGRQRYSRYREGTTHLNALRSKACDDRCISLRPERFSNERGNDTHFRFTHATSSRCRCTEANAAWFERRTRIVGNDLLVCGYADSVENILGRAAV